MWAGVKVACEISFTRFFYWSQPLCGLDQEEGLLEKSGSGV